MVPAMEQVDWIGSGMMEVESSIVWYMYGWRLDVHDAERDAERDRLYYCTRVGR